MNAEPVLVLRIDWSRNVLKACASGASAEPVVALETGQLRGMLGGAVVVVWLVELELELELVMVVELVVVVITSTAAWIAIVMLVVWVIGPLVAPT